MEKFCHFFYNFCRFFSFFSVNCCHFFFIFLFKGEWTAWYIFNVEIDFLLYCIGSVLPITRIYAYKSFDCMHFAYFPFFCVYTEKDIRRDWTKPPYVDLHLNQQPREPVCLKNGKIKIILLKKFLQFTKSVATMSVWSFNFIFSRGWGKGGLADLN